MRVGDRFFQLLQVDYYAQDDGIRRENRQEIVEDLMLQQGPLPDITFPLL
jgi:hypothetical protein